jgi:hypothetical protein
MNWSAAGGITSPLPKCSLGWAIIHESIMRGDVMERFSFGDEERLANLVRIKRIFNQLFTTP